MESWTVSRVAREIFSALIFMECSTIAWRQSIYSFYSFFFCPLFLFCKDTLVVYWPYLNHSW